MQTYVRGIAGALNVAQLGFMIYGFAEMRPLDQIDSTFAAVTILGPAMSLLALFAPWRRVAGG
jgi:hypothetical protein